MPNYLHRITKRYQTSTSTIELLEPESNYVRDPDLSAVEGFSSQYWVITGDVVTLMSVSERDAIDAQALVDRLDAVVSQLDQTEDLLRAFAKVMVSELNLLRSQHALPDRNLAQLKTAMRNELGS